MLQTLNLTHWDSSADASLQHRALAALEEGQVLYLPHLPFTLFPEEAEFLSDQYVNPKTKNISYHTKTGRLQGALCDRAHQKKLEEMMKRYASQSHALISTLFPSYKANLEQGRTSYRPVEIAGRRPPSYRKDDTRLHVDAFPSTPLQGKRILRVFSHVNPCAPRIWRLGAPFPEVVNYFKTQLKKPFPGSARCLKLLKITKELRTPYDHYMLQLHNAMKADLIYQKEVSQIQCEFSPGSTWIVYTDQVSHAAMSGQFTFEQTFYIPLHTLANIELSPYKVLEMAMH